MRQKTDKHAKIQNALSLFTLLFLLGIISFTFSQAAQKQTLKSRGQVQEGIEGNVTPTYWIGEDPNGTRPTALQEPTAPEPTEELITPTIYCLGGVPCTSPEPTNPPIETPEPTDTVEVTEAPEPTVDPCATAQNSIQSHPKKQNEGFTNRFFDWFSQFMDKLVFGKETPPEPEPQTTPAPTDEPVAEPTVNPCITPTVAEEPTTEPTVEPTTEPIPTENAEPTLEQPAPTADPCAANESSIQSTPNKKNKINKKQDERFMGKFFDWFSQFIDKLVFGKETPPEPEPQPAPAPTDEPPAEPTVNPCITPVPQEPAPTTEVPEPTTEEPAPTVQEPAPTNDPCITEDDGSAASIQTYHPKKHRKHHDHGNHYGWFSQLFRLILDFLEELLRRIGMDNPKIDPNPSQPAPQNPCVTIVPTQPSSPTEEPEAEPTQAPEATEGPTQQPNPTPLPTQQPEGENGDGGGNAGSGETRNVKITFYGSYDNDPKGSLGISNPVIHQQAGGIGTYEDPLTFASPEGTGAYEIGAKIYVPLVQKYFIKEDTCAVSWTAPNGCGAVTMVDLYVGNPSSDQSVVECENAITPSGDSQIILNPPSNLPYDPTPIWNQNTKTCMTPHK